jgi:hypothetical protein
MSVQHDTGNSRTGAGQGHPTRDSTQPATGAAANPPETSRTDSYRDTDRKVLSAALVDLETAAREIEACTVRVKELIRRVDGSMRERLARPRDVGLRSPSDFGSRLNPREASGSTTEFEA